MTQQQHNLVNKDQQCDHNNSINQDVPSNVIYGSMSTKQQQHNSLSLISTQHQQYILSSVITQHNNMQEYVNIVGQQYIAINIVNVWSQYSSPGLFVFNDLIFQRNSDCFQTNIY